MNLVKKNKERKNYECIENTVCGMDTIDVLVDCSRPFDERKLQKLKRKLHSYDVRDCVLGADKNIEKWIEPAWNLQYLARKKEFLDSCDAIFQFMAMKSKGKDFLLVVDDNKWTIKELYYILSNAKNHFVNLYIWNDKGSVDISSVQNALFEEYGVVLQKYAAEENANLASDLDGVLFLKKEWKKGKEKRIPFQIGYVVAETEIECERIPLTECDVKDQQMPLVLSGYMYQCAGRRMPYQMAVNFLYQNAKLYKEFGITSVAICELK